MAGSVVRRAHQLSKNVEVEHRDHLPRQLILVVVLGRGQLAAAKAHPATAARRLRIAAPVHVAPTDARARHDGVTHVTKARRASLVD
eukprot:1476643-Pleurochrysis_carterae.AAC.2